MPVDPDCDDGDCGDEPPDPGEECSIDDCTVNNGAIYDATSQGGERRFGGGYTLGYWTNKPYPESQSQLTWNTKYFAHVASDWEEEEIAGVDTLTYQGTSNVGAVRSGEGGVCASDCNSNTILLFDGSYASTSAYYTSFDQDPPVLFLQWRVITLNGVCTFQARKFGPFADNAEYGSWYGENSGKLGVAATWQDPYLGSEDEDTIAFNNDHPWNEYEETIPYPIYGTHTLSLPGEWFSGGVTGFEVVLIVGDRIAAPAPYANADSTTFSVAFSGGKPSFFPSSITFTGSSTGGESVVGASIGRSVINTAPAHPDGWPPTFYPGAPCQRKVEYRSTINKAVISAGGTSGGVSPEFTAGSSTFNEPGNYVESSCELNYLDANLDGPQSGCQNSYFSGTNEECGSIPIYFASASFQGDPLAGPARNSADSVTWTGIWTIYYENNVDYTTHYGNTDNDPSNGYVSSKTQDVIYRQGTITMSRTSCNGASTADVSVTLSSGQISGISVNSGGSCYTAPPAVAISGGGGAGATAYSDVADGAVTQVTVTNPGSNYTSDPAVSPFTVNGMSVAAPVLKPAPCLPEECLGFKATWMGKPRGPKGKDGSYDVEWFLIDDCPGMCTSKPPLQPTRVKKTVLVAVDCFCPE